MIRIFPVLATPQRAMHPLAPSIPTVDNRVPLPLCPSNMLPRVLKPLGTPLGFILYLFNPSIFTLSSHCCAVFSSRK